MCSLCYVFSTQLKEAMRNLPTLSLEVKASGAGCGRLDVLDADDKRFLLSNWRRLEALSCLPFSRDLFMYRDGFCFDSDSIAHAFIASKFLAPGSDHLELFIALQRAFFTDGHDVTDEIIVSTVAQRALSYQSAHCSSDDVLVAMRGREIRGRARDEFSEVRDLGVCRFPKLLIADSGQFRLLSSGFHDASSLVDIIGSALWSD